MFLFMNTTPDGEMFGSGDPEAHLDITMYIENADLSEKHAEIKFLDANGKCPTEPEEQSNGQYLLRDKNSASGTWVRVPHILAEKNHQIFLPNLH